VLRGTTFNGSRLNEENNYLSTISIRTDNRVSRATQPFEPFYKVKKISTRCVNFLPENTSKPALICVKLDSTGQLGDEPGRPYAPGFSRKNGALKELHSKKIAEGRT
jgi:hypothetical protein